MKARRLIVFSSLLMITMQLVGCANKQQVSSSSEDFFTNLKKYEAVATVSFLKDKQSNELSMKQTASMDGTYEMIYLTPKHLEGTIMQCDGEKIIEIYPNTSERVEEKMGAAENEILLTSVTKRLLKGEEVKKQETTLNGKKMITYEMPIEGQYKYLSKEKIWLDKGTLTPVQLEIYDIDGNISIQVIYENFKYNS